MIKFTYDDTYGDTYNEELRMNTGSGLIKEITKTVPPPEGFAGWWLGQQSYVFKTGKSVIYFDLFLSDHGKRRIPPFFKPEEVTNADFFFGTHLHRDHIDISMWPTLANSSPNAVFIVPRALKEIIFNKTGISKKRIIGVKDHETVRFENFTVTGIKSAHEFLDPDPKTGSFPYMGYLIQSIPKNSNNGALIYHPGDTLNYPGLAQALKAFRTNLMCLPINGRDGLRLENGVVGNMTYQEAADLAGYAETQTVMPGHFDMMPGNLEDPAKFKKYMETKYPHIKCLIPDYLKCFTVMV